MSDTAAEAHTIPQYIVGIGASAGGLEALEQFFRQPLPAERVAYVIIQHLSPDFKSMMGEILGRLTSLTIREADRDGILLESGTVYLNMARSSMTIEKDRIRVNPYQFGTTRYRPIDICFESIAAQFQEKGIGIILSGTGQDGRLGAKAIQKNGGLVVTQSLETALFGSMPQAVVESVPAQIPLAADEMPDLLAMYLEDPHRAIETYTDLASNADRFPLLNEENALSYLISILQRAYHVDFSRYKPQTLIRRLERRMNLDHVDNLQRYIERLQNRPQELDQLYRELLIDVTRFYRDPDAFRWIEEKVAPALIRTKSDGETIRVWVAACSSGEEAYSIAILLLESFNRANRSLNLRIFATDLHPQSIAVASAGLYTEEKLEHLPFYLRQKYFTQDGSSYRVNQSLRQKIVFSVHDLLADPPFNDQDLITCRNMLIYVRPEGQASILERFTSALRQDGILFLGPSEHLVGKAINHLTPLSRHWRIYQKISELDSPTRSSYRNKNIIVPQHLQESDQRLKVQQGWEMQLLKQLIPAGFICDQSGQLREVYGDGKAYIQFSVGAVNLNLPDLLVGDLAIAVRNGLLQGSRSGAEVRIANVKVEVLNKTRIVDLRVIPISTAAADPELGQSKPQLYLVAIDEKKELNTLTPVDVNSLSAEEFSEIQSLKLELAFTRESLQSALEELEASNEEMQSANEELTAANEELQSTNEELSSVNEELYSVNTEYQEQNYTLNQLINDTENLQRASGVLTIFLDELLRIRSVTPACYQRFGLIASDIGRPVTQFTPLTGSHGIEKLMSMLHEALQGTPNQVELTMIGTVPMRLRVIPYFGEFDTISGVILHFTDLTDIKAIEADLVLAEARYRSVIEMQEEMICRWRVDDFVITFTNQAYERYAMGDQIGNSLLDYLDQDYLPQLKANLQKVLRTGESQTVEEIQPQEDGSERHFIWRDTPIRDAQGEIVEIQGVGREITEITRAQAALAKANRQINVVNDNIPVWISHVSRELTFLYVNRYYETTFGISGEQAVGRPLKAILGDDLFDYDLPYYHRALLGEQVTYTSYPVIGGQKRTASLQLVPEVNNGEVTGFFIIGHDITSLSETITQLEHSYRRLDVINNRLPIWIAVIDQQHRYVYADDYHKELVDFEADEIIGRPVQEVLGKQPYEAVKERYAQAFAGEEIRYGAQMPLPSGERIDIRVRMGPIYPPGKRESQEIDQIYVTVVNLSALRENL